jgi:TonB family protein
MAPASPASTRGSPHEGNAASTAASRSIASGAVSAAGSSSSVPRSGDAIIAAMLSHRLAAPKQLRARARAVGFRFHPARSGAWRAANETRARRVLTAAAARAPMTVMKQSIGVGLILGFIVVVVGGAMASPAPPPPLLPPSDVVAPTALEVLRVSGEKLIVPDEATKIEIFRSGKTKLVTTYKICVDAAGSVSALNLLKSSGFPDYDAKLLTTMWTWRYRPYLVEGVARPVCTSVTFIYQQRDAPASLSAADRERLALRESGYAVFFTGRDVLVEPGGAPLPRVEARPALLPVLTPAGRAPREDEVHALKVAATGFELVVWCVPDGSASSVREPVLLAKTRKLAGTPVLARVSGVRLRRGAPVDVLRKDGDTVRVRFREDSVVVEGWIPARAVGKLIPLGDDETFSDGSLATVPASTPLRDRPQGAPLTLVPEGEKTWPRKVLELERRRGHALVMFDRDSYLWWAAGWVPVENLGRGREIPSLVQPSKIWSSQRAVVKIREGAPVLLEPGRVAFGRATEDREEEVMDCREGHCKISISSDLGILEAWVAGTALME